MTIRFDQQLIKNPEGKIKYKVFHEGGREHYNIGIWLDATDEELDQIECVEYELHPTFRRRVRKSENRENNFSVTIWTWGMFNIEALISYKDGTTSKHSYFLSYDLPDDDGDNYILVK